MLTLDGVAARESRWSNAALAVAFLVTLYVFYEVVAPFLVPVGIGAFVVALLAPAHERLARVLGGRRWLSALVASCGVLLLLLLPASALLLLLAQQVVELLVWARELLGPHGLEDLLGGRLPPALAPLAERLEALGVPGQLERLVDGAAGWVARMVPGVFGATTVLVVDGFLVVVSMYYFFQDGPRLLAEAGRLSPLEKRYEREFLREFRAVAHTMIYVNLVTSLIQGVIGGVAFWLVGLPQPVAWAALMAVLSLVPIVGTGLVWLPAGVVLLVAGQTWAGLFLLAWGTLLISSVDNVLRPLLAQGRIGLHPLLIFVTIFGGIAAFGPAGAILGPLVGSILTAMVRIWKRDFVPRFEVRLQQAAQEAGDAGDGGTPRRRLLEPQGGPATGSRLPLPTEPDPTRLA